MSDQEKPAAEAIVKCVVLQMYRVSRTPNPPPPPCASLAAASEHWWNPGETAPLPESAARAFAESGVVEAPTKGRMSAAARAFWDSIGRPPEAADGP